ncbi:MAG: SdiA-regulated domain-containing protein [Bacteroidota bacterium]
MIKSSFMLKEMQFWKLLSISVLLAKSTFIFSQYSFNYDMENPQKTIELPESLKEISGISLCETQDFIWAVQDEQGVIFKIEIETGQLVDSLPFWKKGDYEGIEIVKDKMYVLKSSGTIYEVELAGEDSLKIQKFNGHLSKEDDAEGLGYDAQKKELLIACKNGENGERRVYTFDVETDSLSKEPRFVITREEAISYLEAHPKLRKWKKLLKKFNDDKLDFAPSAVAVHPLTQDIYILSSQGKTLVILQSGGTIAHIEKLEKEVHPQPEGICFDQKGNLYISNEGKKKEDMGKIYRFEIGKEK